MSSPQIDPDLTLTEDATYCSMRATLALVGQKWVPRIIYELLQGKRRFNELASLVGGCNSRTLRDRLVSLEEIGILERKVIAVTPPWVEYSLTYKGRELAVALHGLEDWAKAHMSDQPA